ncbi:MAG: cupin domain-containing protein [Deltaproteobacteria bacterium]|nr:cupin domain-containing protein [Deltaproteobacteria bacterium]
MYVSKEPVEPSFDKVGIVGRVFPRTKLADSAEFFTVGTERGHETTIRQRECDFFYYVLEGTGAFIIDGTTHTCTVGDLVTIPHGSWFRYEGRMRLLAASVPPWRPEQEDTKENAG